ncbi:Regulatory protein recX [Oligella urethralis]|uniref:recombination regulator RecX n=1 Tax=Oligella urethralis TaxID=90245 RepID=UPI000DFE5B4A|nr:recombination regulator RecX [Oligella urethralis]SUA60212.1 Regulatory protein recX [Oligella urethralis]
MSSHDSHDPGDYSSLSEELLLKSSAANSKQSKLSLLARAIAFLSRREHSEAELRQKLQRYTDDLDEIDAVLARLQRENWQSDERFVESFVQSREQRWGNQKILQTLSQHKLDSDTLAELRDDLKDTEYQRARELWLKRFGAKYGLDPYDPESEVDEALLQQFKQQSSEAQAKERAKQMRFLASRGFTADVVYRVVNSLGAPEDDE